MQHGNSSRHEKTTVSSGAAAEIFLLLMLVLLPVADQTALPIRRPRRNTAWRTGRALQHLPSKTIRPSPALETASQSAGLRTQDLLFPREPSRLDNGNQFIDLLVVLLPVGIA
jgi:hypothetical protein